MPASGAEGGPRRDFLRILLRAITEQEQRDQAQEANLKADVARLQQDIAAVDWQLRGRMDC